MNTDTETKTLADTIGIPASHLAAFMQYAVARIVEPGEQPTEASLAAAVESYGRITARAAEIATNRGEKWDALVSAIGPAAYARING